MAKNKMIENGNVALCSACNKLSAAARMIVADAMDGCVRVDIDDLAALIASAREHEQAVSLARKLINRGDERIAWARENGFDLQTVRSIVAEYVAADVSIGELVDKLRAAAYAASEPMRAERDAAIAKLIEYETKWVPASNVRAVEATQERKEVEAERDSLAADLAKAREELATVTEQANAANRIVRDDWNEMKSLRAQIVVAKRHADDLALRLEEANLAAAPAAPARADEMWPQLIEARELIGRLVADMKMWGSWGDGVPDDCKSFDDAVAMLAAIHADHRNAPSPLAAQLAEAVALLGRVFKYVIEDKASTPGATRLVRVHNEIRTFLAAIDAGRARAT